MILELNADDYHQRLRPDQRALVDEWLDEQFGNVWRTEQLMLWAYEVVGEGVVRFFRYVRDDKGHRIDIETFDLVVDRPPPLIDDYQPLRT